MLILTRKTGESINIGNDIKITIVSIDGGQVRIGIDAPKDVIIHREEIYKKIINENKAAAGISKLDLKEIARSWKEMKKSKNI